MTEKCIKLLSILPKSTEKKRKQLWFLKYPFMRIKNFSVLEKIRPLISGVLYRCPDH
jgi:hypothetical protein